MPASLVASTNPVGVWKQADVGKTTIRWNTGSPSILGRVYLSSSGSGGIVSNQLFDGDVATGSPGGSRELSVRYGNIYVLSLRSTSGNQELASLTVSVEDIDLKLKIQSVTWAAELMGRNPSQLIFNLIVDAGIDSVRFQFNTLQPTIPLVQVLQGTAILESWFPLNAYPSGGTTHAGTLGLMRALPQEENLTLRIVANGKNFLGRPHPATFATTFTTGSRRATINFDRIRVYADGDTGLADGAGDFLWTFGAGDADTEEPMGEPWPRLEQDISADDPPVAINERITVTKAPRRLWIQVVGTDDDSAPWPWGHLNTLGTRPGFSREGSGFATAPGGDQAWVTGVFDLRKITARLSDQFILETDLLKPVAFRVSGTITVETSPGSAPVFLRPGRVQPSTHVLLTKGESKGLAPGNAGSKDNNARAGWFTLGRDMDGTIYLQDPTIVATFGRAAAWVQLAPEIEGEVIGVASGKEQIHLFAIDPQGKPFYFPITEQRSSIQSTQWTPLGESPGKGLTGTPASIALGDKIVVLARDSAGSLFERILAINSKPEGSWRPIGENLREGIQVLPLDESRYAVFALNTQGNVTYMVCQGSKEGLHDWQTIAGQQGTRLGVAAQGSSVTVALIDDREDGEHLSLLTWRNFPTGRAGSWRNKGLLQNWFMQTIEPAGARLR